MAFTRRLFIASALLLLSLAVFAAGLNSHFELSYRMLTPKEKFKISWAEDIAAMQKQKLLPPQWSEIGQIKLLSDISPVENWIEKVVAPIHLKKDGGLRLEIFMMHFLDDERYGVIQQYNLVEVKSNNTIWELNRLVKLGWVY